MPEIQMPKLSDTMTEGTLVAWKKKKGDQVSAGDVIAEIETDKATMEWESPEDGVLTEIFVEEGGKVNVGDKIAFIGEQDEAAPAPEKKAEKPSAETEAPAPANEKKPETAPPKTEAKAEPASKSEPPKKESAAPAAASGRVKASPFAKKTAQEKGVDLSQVKGTGPGERIVEADVAAASGAPKKSAAAQTDTAARITLTGMRKVIAERLVASKGPVPHFYLNIEVDAGPLMAARAELKSAGEGNDASKITVNDFILKAAAAAAAKVPKVNASFDDDAIILHANVDLAVAVALEEGLVTPVIRAAQKKSLREISELVKDLANRARHKRMKPEEFQGGTMTVSNLGSYGIDNFSAIINPPQGFILAVGAIVKKAVVDECDQIVAGHRLAIGMSCDHRVIDGALGAEYLQSLRQFLQNPALLLI